MSRVATCRVPFASGTVVRRVGVEPTGPCSNGVTARSRPLRDYRRVS